MRVRILSGNYAGSVVEMEQTAAESLLDTGYAEKAPDDVDPAPESEPAALEAQPRGNEPPAAIDE